MRSKTAVGLALSATAAAVAALTWGVVEAVGGAYGLAVAPAVGLAVTLTVVAALRRRCMRGGAAPYLWATLGIATLAAVTYLGPSFGGTPLVVPATLLMMALVLTPPPSRCASGPGTA